MINKLLYWLFDSENEDLNSLCRYQIKSLSLDPSVIEYFKILKNYE